MFTFKQLQRWWRWFCHNAKPLSVLHGKHFSFKYYDTMKTSHMCCDFHWWHILSSATCQGGMFSIQICFDFFFVLWLPCYAICFWHWFITQKTQFYTDYIIHKVWRFYICSWKIQNKFYKGLRYRKMDRSRVFAVLFSCIFRAWPLTPLPLCCKKRNFCFSPC